MLSHNSSQQQRRTISSLYFITTTAARWKFGQMMPFPIFIFFTSPSKGFSWICVFVFVCVINVICICQHITALDFNCELWERGMFIKGSSGEPAKGSHVFPIIPSWTWGKGCTMFGLAMYKVKKKKIYLFQSIAM